MTTDTKVADLPKAWRATSKAAGSTPVAATFNVCADELDAALSRQDAQPAQPDEVDFYVCTNCDAYYRDSPVSECDCAVGARDFRHVRMAPVTQPEKQGAGDVIASLQRYRMAFSPVTEQMGLYKDDSGSYVKLSDVEAALARQDADKPSAPVGQEWTDEQCIEFASCAFRHAPRNPPDGVELADIRMAASRVMRSARPPAAQAVDLEQFRGAVEAYKAAVNEDCYFDPSDYDENIAYSDRLLALIDQQAGQAGGGA